MPAKTVAPDLTASCFSTRNSIFGGRKAAEINLVMANKYPRSDKMDGLIQLCAYMNRGQKNDRNIHILNAYMWIEFLLRDKDTF